MTALFPTRPEPSTGAWGRGAQRDRSQKVDVHAQRGTRAAWPKPEVHQEAEQAQQHEPQLGGETAARAAQVVQVAPGAPEGPKPGQAEMRTGHEQ